MTLKRDPGRLIVSVCLFVCFQTFGRVAAREWLFVKNDMIAQD